MQNYNQYSNLPPRKLKRLKYCYHTFLHPLNTMFLTLIRKFRISVIHNFGSSDNISNYICPWNGLLHQLASQAREAPG